MAGPLRSASRVFIKERLTRGDSARAARLSYNELVSLSPSEIGSRWGARWMSLSGARKTTPKEVHRVQSALSRKDRADRREARATMRLRTEASRTEAAVLGLPEPTADYQKAHDAGALYRATHDERYREQFEEGSP